MEPLLDDTWEWDGTSWSERTPLTRPGRLEPAMAFDPVRRVVVMFGGITGAGASADTWEWDGVNWIERIHRALLLVTNQGATWARSFEAPFESRERCLAADTDVDGDGLGGCDDPDCFGRCAPGCPVGQTCGAGASRCGDAMCGAVEDHVICPDDCAAPWPRERERWR